MKKLLYRNNLKNREFGDAERATIAQRQGASEHPNSEAKPTQPKTDSSGCFGISLKKHLTSGLAALAGIFLLTTGFERHHLHPLKPVSAEMLPTFSLEESKVVVVTKAMSPEDSKRNFGHDLVSRGVQPVQITIENNTANEYSLCPSSVDLPRLEASKVAFKVTKSAIPRAIGYKIAGFLFWPFMIPGTIDSIRVMSHHKKIKKDMKAKSIKEEVVAPYSVFNRVLFVPKDKFQESFKVTLIDIESLQATEFQTTVEGAEVAT